jgi:hypothetical protein
MGTGICRAILVTLAMALSAGCSAVKTYPNHLDKNLQIRSETVAGTALFRVRTAVGVYRVDERCELDFEGVVDIDQSTVSVGIPAGRWSYLDFTFSDPSLAGGSSSSVSRETLFRPRAGYRYDIAVSYKRDISIREIPARGGAGRKVDFREIRACRPPWRAAAHSAVTSDR